MNASAAAWLADCRAPAPSAVDLAVHVAKTTERDALLRVCVVATNLDAKLRVARRAAEVSAAQAAQLRAALAGHAHTAILMIERVQEAEPVLKAVLAWMEDPMSDGLTDRLTAAGEAYRKRVEARS